MMDDPRLFREECEELSQEELKERKAELLKYISDYENHALPEGDYLMKPSPEFIVSMYKKYLNELDEVMQKFSSDGKSADFKECINREVLLSKLGYLPETRDKRKKYATEKEFILSELQTIKTELQLGIGVNEPYNPCTRAQSCLDEFNYNINNKNWHDSIYNLYEVIEADKNGIYNNYFNKDYKYSEYIYSEEKSIILKMVDKLEILLSTISD